MKYTKPRLSFELLRYVRDHRPTEAEFIAWLGGPAVAGRYHVLRKAGLLVLDGDRVTLSPHHLSADGRTFSYGIQVFFIDEDVIRVYRYAPV